MVTSTIVIEVHMRLQARALGQIPGHFRTQSNLSDGVGFALSIEVDGGNVISTISSSDDPRGYFLGTTLARSTNFARRFGRLSSFGTALAYEALQQIHNAFVLGDFGTKITMSSSDALVTLAARDVDVGQFASGFVAGDPGFTLSNREGESCADFGNDLFL